MENQCHWDQVHAYLMNRRRYQIEYIFYNYTKTPSFQCTHVHYLRCLCSWKQGLLKYAFQSSMKQLVSSYFNLILIFFPLFIALQSISVHKLYTEVFDDSCSTLIRYDSFMFYSIKLFFSHKHSRNIAIGLICFILFLLFNTRILNCVEMKRKIGYDIRLCFTNGCYKNFNTTYISTVSLAAGL